MGSGAKILGNVTMGEGAAIGVIALSLVAACAARVAIARAQDEPTPTFGTTVVVPGCIGAAGSKARSIICATSRASPFERACPTSKR